MEKEYLIEKWLSNELTELEQNAFNQLPDASFYTELVQEAQRFKKPEKVKALPFTTLTEKLEKRKIKKLSHLNKTLLRIAAILILGFGILYISLRNYTTTVNTELASKENILLPDHSKVTLNESSQIKYNVSHWEKNREVTLTGEAFFEVAKGEKFDVITSQGTVQVLGTEFNVKARNNMIEVICYEGSVLVTSGIHIIKLSPSEGVAISDSVANRFYIPVSKPQWTQEMSVFNRSTIQEVIKELEQQYKTKVSVSDIDTTLLFTGAFKYDNLDNALKSICDPLNLAYTIKNNKVHIKKINE